jgi:FtsP/CotA-like multicopper oxidase with cupredoxin domain
MSLSRRTMLSRAALLAGGALVAGAAEAQDPHAGHQHHPPAAPPPAPPPAAKRQAPAARKESPGKLPYTPVTTPNGRTLPFRMNGGFKEFHLIAEPVQQEFAPGMTVNAWGYNGSTPGPTLEMVEGDQVRIYVTNKLPEPTSVHWHGILLPSGMDGVSGLSQPRIEPGETYVYEYKLRQHGTYMYHPHADEMVQMALGLMGFLIVHPRKRPDPPIDRDFCLFPHMWAIPPGAKTPDPAVMLDFNLFTFNGKIYPGTAPLLIRQDERVRIRLANLSMTSHPIHMHGHVLWVVETDGGPIPKSAWWPETTVNVPPGTTRAFEFVADNPGDWTLHCHKTHHAMNAMGHDVPNLIGVDKTGIDEKLGQLIDGYMTMGTTGMSEHSEHVHHMKGVANTIPMMTGDGTFGPIEMGGMFTLVKIRKDLENLDEDPGWYRHPPGTIARKVENPPDFGDLE